MPISIEPKSARKSMRVALRTDQREVLTMMLFNKLTILPSKSIDTILYIKYNFSLLIWQWIVFICYAYDIQSILIKRFIS